MMNQPSDRRGRSCRRLAVLVALSVLGGRPIYAELPPFPRFDQARIEEALARQKEAEALAAYYNFAQRLADLEETRRKAAHDEREQLKFEVKRLRLILDQKQWALQSFERLDRQLLPSSPGAAENQLAAGWGRRPRPESDGVRSQMIRWKRAIDTNRQQFLGFSSEHNRGAIKSGRALNFFLERCGEMATDLKIYRDEIGTTTELIQAEQRQAAAPGNAVMIEAEKRKSAVLKGLSPEEYAKALATRRAVLDELRGRPFLTQDDVRSISVMKGLIGHKMTIRLNSDEPLPLEWPEVIRLDENYAPLCENLEKAKAKAIDVLKSGRQIPPELHQSMMTTTDELCAACEEKSRQAFAGLRDAGGTAASGTSERAFEFTVAKRFLRQLRSGVIRFLTATRPEHVAVETFPPVGQMAAVDELFEYMSRHGYRFAEAGPNDEVVYEKLFRAMVQYYLNLYSMQKSIEADQQRLVQTEDQIENLLKVELGQTPWFSAGFAPGRGLQIQGGAGAAPGVQ